MPIPLATLGWLLQWRGRHVSEPEEDSQDESEGEPASEGREDTEEEEG